ncbi:MAG: ATP-binding protein [Alphaproteobacteria bacterium]|nr:ATP-binding protein [Alphaproteobacteria bacterium]
MVAYERPQKSTLVARLNEKPVRLTLVTGPRQSGKTTLVRQVLRDIDRPCRYLAVDEPDPVTFSPFPRDDVEPEATEAGSIGPRTSERDERWLVRRWEEARVDAERSEQGFVLVFDEIQKVANWSEAVKGLWDADRRDARNLHVVLLGSAPLILQRGMTESLAGRYETIRLTHWSFVEMSDAFGVDLPGYVYFGGYPGAAAIMHDEERWREYITDSVIEPNIERDVLAMQRVDKPALLKRVFELGAGYSGQILSYTKMLGQLQDAGNTTTLARYLDLLSHGGLIAGLSNHANHAHRVRASSPKLNVLNTALMSAGSGYTFEEAQADRSWWGRLVESAVGAHLYNTRTPSLGLRYWRNRGREVDFVLERGRRLVAFEVKSGTRRVSPSGLREFTERFDVERSVLVGEGGVPLSEFLSTPARDWFERS